MRYVLFVLMVCVHTTHAQSTTPTIHNPVHEGYIPVADSVRLYYRTVGQGLDTVVVVHGGPGFHSNYLIPDLTPLAARYTLLFFDQRNAGRSTLLADTTLLHAHHLVADMEALRKHFRLERMTLLGHSWGGLLVGLYAEKHPERVERMVLVGAVAPAMATMGRFNPMARLDSLANADRLRNLKAYQSDPPDSTKACWDYHAVWARGYFSDAVQVRRMWGDMCNVPQAAMLNPTRSYPMQTLGAWDIRPGLARVRAPTLVVHGELDPIHMPAAESWRDALPNSRLLRVPDSAHSPFVDQPAVFFTAVETFLGGSWPDSSVLSARGAATVRPGDHEASPYLAARAYVAAVEGKLMESIARADWDDVADIYTEDAVILAPGVPLISGRQAIRSFWRTAWMKGMRSLELQIVDLKGDGDHLTVYGKYEMLDDAELALDVGKFVALYTRVGSEWRLHTDVFNSSMETRSPLEVPDYLTGAR